MGSMYDRILVLCKERGVKPGRVCTDTGLSRGMMSDLKMGRTKELSAKNTKIIADYFGVSTDYLLGNVSEPYFYLDNERIKRELNSYGDEPEKAPTPEGERNAENLVNEDLELTDFLEMLRNRPECRMLFSVSKDASKEDVEKAVAIIEALRGMEERG